MKVSYQHMEQITAQYLYVCPATHETTCQRAMDRRDIAPACQECGAETQRVLYPGVLTVDGFAGSMKRARYAEAGKRLLNSEHGDPQRRKQFYPMKG